MTAHTPRNNFLFALGLALVLAACTPTVTPPGQVMGAAHADARLVEAAFVTADGMALPVRKWLPPDGGNVRAVVLAVHGFNDYSKAFDKVPGAPGVGPTLAARGIAVYAYDQRSFGQAPNRGVWPGSAALVGDLKLFTRMLKNQYPNVPLYLLGESMGGAVVMAALTDRDPPAVAGAILAAPAVWARATMPLTYRVVLWLGAHVVPGYKPTGKGLGVQASDNIDMLRDNARDPLFIKATRVDAVYGLADLMDQALAAAPRIAALPVLYLYGAKDEIIPGNATAAALKSLTVADADAHVAYYANGWHMILRDKQAGAVLDDVAAFIQSAKAPLPSGADADALARLQATVTH